MDVTPDGRQTLKDYFGERWGKAGPFKPKAHYVCWGDQLSYFFTNEFAIADRIDDILTVYRSESTGELIGCKIKGVSLLAKNVASIMKIEDGEIQIRFLLLNAAGTGPSAQYYYDVSDHCGDAAIPLEEILAKAATLRSRVRGRL